MIANDIHALLVLACAVIGAVLLTCSVLRDKGWKLHESILAILAVGIWISGICYATSIASP